MFRARVTELFGMEYPVIGGCMRWTALRIIGRAPSKGAPRGGAAEKVHWMGMEVS